VSWTTGAGTPGGGWPQAGEPVRGRGLPDGAVVVYRTPAARAVLATFFPVMLLLAYARVRGSDLPPSQLVNPGTLAVTGAAVVTLGLVCLPAGRRAQLAGGPGWVAHRRWPLASWRVVQLDAVRQYSLRAYATRGPRMVSLRIVDADGNRLTVTATASQPWWGPLLHDIAAQGAQQIDAGRRDRLGTGPAYLVAAAVLVVSLLPLAYLAAGPGHLLPEGFAGVFTSSACRAAAAAEKQQGSGPSPSWGQTLQTGGATWQLIDHVPATVAQVAGHTADPSARLKQLTADGATGGYQVTYLGPDGSRIAVDAITFGTPTGAVHYLHYVNRATCAHFSGTSGPAPGEVRWTSGKTYGAARWAAGSTVYDMSPVLESPEATRNEVDELAAAAQATASG
jgi:hypothetical protein